jgi:hypothetical protein
MSNLKDTDIEDLFRRASEKYPLRTDSADWDRMAAALEKDPPQTPDGEEVTDKRRKRRFLWLLLVLPLAGAGYYAMQGRGKGSIAAGTAATTSVGTRTAANAGNGAAAAAGSATTRNATTNAAAGSATTNEGAGTATTGTADAKSGEPAVAGTAGEKRAGTAASTAGGSTPARTAASTATGVTSTGDGATTDARTVATAANRRGMAKFTTGGAGNTGIRMAAHNGIQPISSRGGAQNNPAGVNGGGLQGGNAAKNGGGLRSADAAKNGGGLRSGDAGVNGGGLRSGDAGVNGGGLESGDVAKKGTDLQSGGDLQNGAGPWRVQGVQLAFIPRDYFLSVLVKAPAAIAVMDSSRSKKKEKQTVARHFYAGILASPDISTVKMQAVKGTGSTFGLVLGYSINRRWSIETGVYADRKHYYTDGEYFSTKNIYMQPNWKLVNANGVCYMWEIPLNVRYNFNPGAKTAWFATAGSSTYLMSEQKYVYGWKSGSYQWDSNADIKKSSQYPFSIINLSVGFEQRLGKVGSLRLEPFVRLPLTGVGTGKLPIMSAGVNIGITRQLW